jgi:putative ABC transport system permease protein
MRSLLFGVGPADPLTFVAISVLLAFVTLLASYIQANRAAHIDPIVSLRYE